MFGMYQGKLILDHIINNLNGFSKMFEKEELNA